MADYRTLFNRFLTQPENGSGETRAYCPVHEDPGSSRSDSASFNFQKGVWRCNSCGEGGSIGELAAAMRARRNGGVASNRRVNPVRSSKVVDINTREEVQPLPTEEDVALWHERLLVSASQRDYLLEERGLTLETIKEYQLGWYQGRYSIPVRDISGDIVNVRRYNPKARKSKDKMISIAGHGGARIFRPDLLADYKEVILVEGEMDFMVARQVGLPASTHTAGAGTFLAEWGPLFSEKVVYICYDVDSSGERGALKAAKVLALHADKVYIIKLPLDIEGGDITDYFIAQGNTVESFRLLMAEAGVRPFAEKRSARVAPTTGRAVSLEETQNVDYGSDPLEVVIAIAGKQSPPYVLPKTIHARCDQGKGNVCNVCPMAAWNGEHIERLARNDSTILDFVDANDKSKKQTLRNIVGARCSDRVEFETTEHWAVEELVVTNSLDHRGEEEMKPVSRKVMNVGTYSTPINTTARIVGSQVPSPDSQRGVFLSWHLEPTQTSLDRFKVGEGMVKLLERFRPDDGQTPLEKCFEIAHDIAANVTHIYGRPQLHVAYDLVWHSALDFNFMGKRIEKGWLECLVMGDTRTGKSECANQLIRHYNAGSLKSCEGMTFAGLVGGVQQMSNRWFVTWGVIPLNDRRLVVLDEVSGLKDKNVIENMSAIRSSGKAQLTKIQTDETSARTRLVWISNPPNGDRLRDMPGSAMAAISALIRNPEDVARFDFAIACAGEDVDAKLINTSHHPKVKHTYTKKACGTLVLWAWSRKIEDIVWAEGAEEHVVNMAVDMGDRYVADPPLVQIENIRMKIARLAVAIAARTFSTDETGEKVVVYAEHVESAVEFLDQVYGMDALGYLRQSRRIISARRRAGERRAEVRTYLSGEKGVLSALLSIGDSTFKVRDFSEFGSLDTYDAQIAVRNLLEWKMIRRLAKGNIRMEPALVELLKEFEDADE